MRVRDGVVSVSATDLSNFLACRHKTSLDLEVVQGLRRRPERDDPMLTLLRERGADHERRYVLALAEAGVDVDLIDTELDREAQVAATHRAMTRGAGAIVQGALESGAWFGRADVLRRVPGRSRFGAWQYEAVDTKLAQDTRAGTILQLCLYSWLLEATQASAPEYFHVVTPAADERYRVAEYAAYFRLVREAFVAKGLTGHTPTYPEPAAHCDVCEWWSVCNARRRADDHLSFVANLTVTQRRELETIGVRTLEALGRQPLPPGFRPERGSREALDRAQHQASLQLRSRETGQPVIERLTIEAQLGLCRLPAPSPGDVFLDLESAAFARDGGREYLFGLSSIDSSDDVYERRWAMDDASERAAFEATMDRLIDAWARDPDMHVYHYGAYEPAALRRLMCRQSTRGVELDRLLRAERFVDLFAVVRHAIRAGVESYSIKELERFTGYRRRVSLPQAGDSRRAIEHALEMASPHAITSDDREIVEGYNRDDCVSTRRLRDWLEDVRDEAIAAGEDVPRWAPVTPEGEPSKAIDAETDALRARLLATLPAEPAAWTDADRARHLLAYLIDWHRREDKASWWEYFRMRDLAPEDLLREIKALTGLEFAARIETVLHAKTRKPTGSVIDRYRYPDQDAEMPIGEPVASMTKRHVATVAGFDREARTLDLKKSGGMADEHPDAVFLFSHVRNEAVQRAVMAYAETLLARGAENAGDCRDALLFRRPPRLAAGSLEARSGEDAVDVAVRVGLELDGSVLAIQGPPGAGKTFTGARMICALVRAGRRVGVAAHSHKVIRHLLDAAEREAREQGFSIARAHRMNEPGDAPTPVVEVTRAGRDGHDEARALLQRGGVQVLGGTAWLWAHESACDPVDVLFVDEAGQMSLADAIAVGRSARNLVLLGDQQQLEQPQKAAHPDGVDVSVLDHVLGGARTVPDGLGIFLPTTWRLAPSLAALTSELFYEGKLQARPSLDCQRLVGAAPFDQGSFLLLTPHLGNQSASDEEVSAIASLVRRLLAPEAAWTDQDGIVRAMTPHDIRVITPYNAQVSRLAHALEGTGVPIGTVDKFQGQEAAVAIYSMATSTPDDAPRGMEFLYDLHRFNVATSRGRCVRVVVLSPALLEPDCRTPRQMSLANALCRYREVATAIEAPIA